MLNPRTRRVARAPLAGALIAMALIGCGAGRAGRDAAPAPPLPAAPWLAGHDDRAAAARPDGLLASPALRCVLDVADRKRAGLDVLEGVAAEAPPAITRALVLAMAARPDGHDYLALGAGLLAERGAVAEARALLESPALAAHPPMATEYRVRVGLEAPFNQYRVLQTVRELALAGEHDAAARLFADHVAPAARTDNTAHYLIALVALGRETEAEAVLRAAPRDAQWELHVAWTRFALRARRDVPAAVARLVAARAARGVDWREDDPMVRAVLTFARGLGLGREVAPLRRALIDDLAAGRSAVLGHLTLSRIADEVEALGVDGERRALAPALAPDRTTVDRLQVAATDALHRGSLDQALAAVEASHMAPLWARLWVRHVAQGSDPGFEERLAAAACRQAAP